MGNQFSGRRKASALKLLAGNPGKRKLDKEPIPPPGEIVMPEVLSDAARKVWERVAPVCLHMGTLTTADVAAFRTYCELQGTLDELWTTKGQEDFDWQKELKYATLIRVYYERFGLEPSGRSRLKLAPKDEPASKWSGVLG